MATVEPGSGVDRAAGRLAPVARVVEAAEKGDPILRTALPELMSSLTLPRDVVARDREQGFLGQRSPAGLGGTGAVVWRGVALFAASAESQPTLLVDERTAGPMRRIDGTDFWVCLATLEPGRLHTYQFGIDGVWAPGSDVAGYVDESYEQSGVPRGTLSDRTSIASRVYPGATTEYRVYANHGIDQVRGAPVMVWHDGRLCVGSQDLLGMRMQIVTDNLVALGRIPPMVHVLVSPSSPGDEIGDGVPDDERADAMRSVQYDTVSDRYGLHLLEEVLPDVEQTYRLRRDGYSRGSAGISSGGICSFTLAWFRPDEFSRVHSVVGSFTGLQWDPDDVRPGGFMLSDLVRREPRRNIRVWLSDGSNDLEVGPQGLRRLFIAGSWPLNNIQLANALKLSGYDFRFRFGGGYHSVGQAALDLPESLAWLWRDYDPERTAQEYQQDPRERELPVFRVGITNRLT